MQQNKGSSDDNYHDLLKSSKIQQIIQLHNSNACYYQGIQYAFQVIDMVNAYKKDSQNKQMRQKIYQKLEVSQQQIEKLKEQSLKQYGGFRFDINKMFMSNKSGGLGMIERKCRFTQKGVLEYENEKSQPKLKEIIDFRSIIEVYNAKSNPSKLAWIKQHAKHPFRIILIDKNKAEKAVYFTNPDDAFTVRVYLIQKYKAKVQVERIRQIFQIFAHSTETKTAQGFAQKLFQWRKHQPKDRKSLKVEDPKQNEIKLFNNQNILNKFTQKHFEVDRDSHPLSQYYFGDKRQLSFEKGIAYDSRSEFGLTKSPDKKKQIQKINETGKKLIPYGLVEKLKRYNKSSIKDVLYKWRQYIECLNEEKKSEIIINGQTQLSSIMNTVRDRELSSRPSKRSRDLQRRVLRFRYLKFISKSVSLIPYKFQLEVRLQKSLRPTLSEVLVYTTFQTINKNKNDSESVVYQLIKCQNNQIDDLRVVNNELQLLGEIERYRLNLRLRQMISSQIMGQKEVNLKDLTLLNGSFTIDIFQLNNIMVMDNNNNKIQQMMSNMASWQISGQLIDEYRILNQGNKSIGGDNLQFIADMMLNITVSQFTDAINNNDDSDIDNNETYQRKLLSMLPILNENIKRQLSDLLNHKRIIIDKINVTKLFSFVPIINTLSTVIPTQQQYQLLGISYKVLENVGVITQYSPCFMHVDILRHLISSGLFNSRMELLQAFLSIITNWSIVFLSNSQQTNLPQTIGLMESVTSPQQKLSLIKVIIQHLLQTQCKQLLSECNKRNVPLVALILDYCGCLLTKNLSSRLWMGLMCGVFSEKNANMIPIELSLVLIAVYICVVAGEQLELVNRCSMVMDNSINCVLQIFNNKLKQLTQSILSFVNQKYIQYFVSQSISKEIQQIRMKFYTRETAALRHKTASRHTEKMAITSGVLNGVRIAKLFTTNNTQNIHSNITPKCLHLCFTTLPNISGSLYIRTASTEFQCTQYQLNPYFILPDINSPIQLEFIDSKSNQYTFQLQIDIGFGFFTEQVKNNKNSNLIVFQYWAALIDSNILNHNGSYINLKELQNSFSSSITVHDIKQRLLKQPNQSFLFQFIQKQLSKKYQSNSSDSSGQQILRKIKIAFAQNNKINQYDLFLYLTANRHASLKEKIFSLFQYADHVSVEIFLSISSNNLRRIILRDLFKVMSMPINSLQFQSLYQGMMHQWSSCQVPKILKARFICCYEQELQIQIEKEVYQYLEKRAQKYIYYDIYIEELIEFLKPVIIKELNKTKQILNEGLLKLIISSEGKVKFHEFRILIRNNNKEFVIDENSLPQFMYEEKLQCMKPRVLKIQATKQNTQLLDTTFSPIKGNSYKDIISDKATSASKIILPIPSNIKKSSQVESSISQSQSRFKDQTKNLKQKSQLFIQLSNKSKNHHDREMQQLNLVKYILNKAKKIVSLRYNNKCKGQVVFGEFRLFESVNDQVYLKKNNLELLNVEEVYANNVRTIDLSFLHNSSYLLQLHTNFNTELLQYCHQIGIQNNLHRIINPDENQPTQVYFITTNTKSQNYIKYNQLQAKIMINYGYGIIRWEKCRLVGYFEMKRQKSNKKDKRMYLVVLDGKQKIIEENYIKIEEANHKQVKNLGIITEKNKQKWQNFMI